MKSFYICNLHIFNFYLIYLYENKRYALHITEILIQILKIRSLLNFKIIKLRLFFIRKRLYY